MCCRSGLISIVAAAVCGFLQPACGVDFVRIPHDPNAGGYEAFPDVCRLQDNRLMAVFYAGYGHVSVPNDRWPNGGRVSYSTSSDEGFTWTVPQTLYDGPDDDRDPSIVQLADGRIVCDFQRQTTQGNKGSWTLTSTNGGANWTDLRQIYPYHGVTSPIRPLSNGRLVLGMIADTGSGAVQGTGAVGSSNDQGTTWNAAVAIPPPLDGAPIDSETDVIELKTNGSFDNSSPNLFAVQRVTEQGWPMYSSLSSDGGGSWSVSQPMPFSGHCPYLHRTPNNIILLGYRNSQNATTSLRYSLNECQTWSSEVVVDNVGGAYPSIVDLKDGTELIVYYEEGTGSSIRVRRFRAAPTGIDWLPVVSSPIPEPGTVSLLITGAMGLLGYNWLRSR